MGRKKNSNIAVPASISLPVQAYVKDVEQALKDNGKWKETDQAVLYMLAVQMDIFIRASHALTCGEDLLVMDGREELVINNKITITNKAQKLILDIMDRFALTPLARKQLGLLEPVKDSPLAKFLAI